MTEEECLIPCMPSLPVVKINHLLVQVPKNANYWSTMADDMLIYNDLWMATNGACFRVIPRVHYYTLLVTPLGICMHPKRFLITYGR